jgi:hypothetical protein
MISSTFRCAGFAARSSAAAADARANSNNKAWRLFTAGFSVGGKWQAVVIIVESIEEGRQRG